MKHVLVVNHEVCTGCRMCEAVCSSRFGGEVNPIKSRVQVIKWEKSGIDIPMVCQQCEEPFCQLVCPTEAIYEDEKTHAFLINEDKCIGCRACVMICPFGGISFDAEKNKAAKCDFCKGDPLCAKFCPTGAIQYLPCTIVALQKKREAASKIEESMKKSVIPIYFSVR